MSATTSSLSGSPGSLYRSTSDIRLKDRDQNDGKEERKLPRPSGLNRVRSTPQMRSKGRALLLEDSSLQAKIQKAILTKLGYTCDWAPTLSQAVQFLQDSTKSYKCVVTDHNINSEAAATPQERAYVQQLTNLLFPGGKPVGCDEGILLLEYIQQHLSKQPVKVLISAFDGGDGSTYSSNIINAAHARGAHFLSKPISMDRLNPLLTSPFILPPSDPGLPPGESKATSTSSASTIASTFAATSAPQLKRGDSVPEGSPQEEGDDNYSLLTSDSSLNNPFSSLTLRSLSVPTGAGASKNENRSEGGEEGKSVEGTTLADEDKERKTSKRSDDSDEVNNSSTGGESITAVDKPPTGNKAPKNTMQKA